MKTSWFAYIRQENFAPLCSLCKGDFIPKTVTFCSPHT
jgi:hypothetical protein